MTYRRTTNDDDNDNSIKREEVDELSKRWKEPKSEIGGLVCVNVSKPIDLLSTCRMVNKIYSCACIMVYGAVFSWLESCHDSNKNETWPICIILHRDEQKTYRSKINSALNFWLRTNGWQTVECIYEIGIDKSWKYIHKQATHTHERALIPNETKCDASMVNKLKLKSQRELESGNEWKSRSITVCPINKCL